MTNPRIAGIVVACGFTALAVEASAQTSSVGARKRQADTGKPIEKATREAPPRPRNLVYEQFAFTAEKPALPKTFRPGDLVTIIIREQRKWEADADLESKREFDLKSEIDAFIKHIDGGIGSSNFTRGKPNIDYRLDQKLKTEGDSQREDRLTTRLTARIIDVKPNGLLVLEGRAQIAHDEEISEITLTGLCRKEDVTADNTVLSTQLADKMVRIANEGALRAAASRGWITKFLDWVRPF